MQLFQGHRNHDLFVISDPAELHHCVKVTRHKTGDRILGTDFGGEIWSTIIRHFNETELTAEITGVHTKDFEYPQIAIAISLTQNTDRFEWFVEKATETGIDCIVPLICARTEQKKDRSERWNKIILASAKQCLRPSLPVLESLQAFNHFISTSRPDQRYICHCENADIPFLGNSYQATGDAVILIGPEGDFTAQEIQSAREAGYREVNLGPDRLRVETAGIASGMICKTLQCMK